MVYTVQKLATIAGISVRTLHYYDEIGLLKPSSIGDNGYRYYAEKELVRLQQILFFRELAFPLEDIIKIMQSPTYDMEEALRQQRKLLEAKRKRITQLLQTIDKTLKGGEHMNNDDLFAGFTEDQLEELKEEAKKRWGESDAYKQSAERTKHWTKEDYNRIAKEGKLLTQQLAKAMDLPIENSEVQKLIAQHHKSIEVFYDCSYEMYRGLGQLYVTDPRFTATYDKVRPGLAAWMQKAMNYYCDQHEK